ncbi:hypothetical protein BG011_005396 [Mortierella polycephala]|uniref:P-loop containing nucleoside triphosphate hydrolase protein n=1 Tax=Mortierella polycephala TaxID=41804 RepID=A0A9P6PW39_9FUNG|nr:hypothetical protein BG011_005396 [Mortierella polycephala]
MSDSRVDYQPLRSEVLDSPSSDVQRERSLDLDNTYSTRHTKEVDGDEDGIHADECQELVSPSERTFVDFQQRQQLRDQEDQDDGDDYNPKKAAAEWAIRLQAFFCAALLGVSSHFTLHMTGPLKDVLKENMGISNTQFSLLQSSLTLFPTIMPLIGGLLIERYGTGPSSIVFTTIVIFGQTVVILGCWTHSIKIMILGYCLFGLGAAPITIIQETIWVRYFKKNGLALVLALGLTSGKLSGFLSLATSVPLATLQPFGFVTPFIVSLVISIIAWVMNIVFLLLLEKPKEGTDAMTKITILLKAKRTNLGWREVYGFSSMFWTMLVISFLVGASWNPFMHQASNIVKHHYGLSDEQAGWEASIILAVPLVIYPFLGTFIDHAGKRAWLLLVTTGLLISTHILLLIPYSVVIIPPTIPMLLFALSLSLGTLSIVTSMPILTKHVPTGLGLHRSIDNIGATLLGTVAGMIQDYSGGDLDGEARTENFFDRIYHHLFPTKVDQAQQEREDVQLVGLFLAVALLAFVACAIFVWGDYHWTDGEGGKTGLVNGVYGKKEPIRNKKKSRRIIRNREGGYNRRSHEVLEAMTLEPFFELDDEPDAEEVSMNEIGSSGAVRSHSLSQTGTNGHRPSLGSEGPMTFRELDRLNNRQSFERDRLRDEVESESDSESDNGEERFGVRIESGEDEVPQFKKSQAHFWIILQGAPIPGKARFFATEAALAAEEPVAVSARTRATRTNRAATETLMPLSTSVPKLRRTRSKATTEKAAEPENEIATKVIKVKDETKKPTRTRKPSARAQAESANLAIKLAMTKAAPVTQLRPYQQECIDTCLDNLQNGIMRQIVSLPVGSGKTVIFSHLMKKVPSPFPGAHKTLILAHRRELLEQTQTHVLRNGTGLTVSMDQGTRNADMNADVIVASVPSLGRIGTPRLLKYDPKEFKCIIIDEAHHAAADSYGRILKHFGAHMPDTHVFVYGCSATVRRHDGLKLGGVFDHISFHKEFITMIEDKWLCGLRVSTIQTDYNLRNVKTQRGDFVQSELSLECNTPIRNDIIVRSYMTYCKERESTVVFAVDIAHLEELTKVFRQYGYDARGLSSKTGDIERTQMLKDFRERKFPVIVNCGILTEGTDIPVIDSIVMARPTKSNVLFQQMLGRGMRLYPGKEDCLVLDFVDIVRGDGLVTLPTLLGLDTNAILKNGTMINKQEDVDALRERDPEDEENEEGVGPDIDTKLARIRVLEYENPYQLIGDCSGAPRGLWEMSPNAWVRVGPDAYVLASRSATYRVEKSSKDGLYRCEKRATFRKRDSEHNEPDQANHGEFMKYVRDDIANRIKQRKEKLQQPKQEGMFKSKGTMLPIQADTARDCIHGVDTYVLKKEGHFPHIVGRHAKWRKRPASKSQMQFLKKLGYDPDSLEDIGGDSAAKGSSSLDEEVAMQRRWRREAAAKLTMGQAANMITRLVNGAGKDWEESKKLRAKRAKALAKDIGVEVGPIPKFVDV